MDCSDIINDSDLTIAINDTVDHIIEFAKVTEKGKIKQKKSENLASGANVAENHFWPLLI